MNYELKCKSNMFLQLIKFKSVLVTLLTTNNNKWLLHKHYPFVPTGMQNVPLHRPGEQVYWDMHFDMPAHM